MGPVTTAIPHVSNGVVVRFHPAEYTAYITLLKKEERKIIKDKKPRKETKEDKRKKRKEKKGDLRGRDVLVDIVFGTGPGCVAVTFVHTSTHCHHVHFINNAWLQG